MERVETFLHHIWGLKSSTPALGPPEFAALVGTTENAEFCDFIFTTYEPIAQYRPYLHLRCSMLYVICYIVCKSFLSATQP